jgi:hypothetical protein
LLALIFIDAKSWLVVESALKDPDDETGADLGCEGRSLSRFEGPLHRGSAKILWYPFFPGCSVVLPSQ